MLIILCLLYHTITLKVNSLTIQLIERILLLITMQVTYIAFLFGKHVVEKLLVSYFNEIDIKNNKIHFCTLQVIKKMFRKLSKQLQIIWMDYWVSFLYISHYFLHSYFL